MDVNTSVSAYGSNAPPDSMEALIAWSSARSPEDSSAPIRRAVATVSRAKPSLPAIRAKLARKHNIWNNVPLWPSSVLSEMASSIHRLASSVWPGPPKRLFRKWCHDNDTSAPR